MWKQHQHLHTDGCECVDWRRVNSRPRQERRSETWRRKMSWLIMSPAKLNNCDEDSNNNVVGLIKAGSGPCCLAVRGHYKQDDSGFTTNTCAQVSLIDTCTCTHSCHFSPVRLQGVFADEKFSAIALQTPSRWCAEHITAHCSCLEYATLPMCWTFWWTDVVVLVNLRRWHLKPERYRMTTTFWISISSTVKNNLPGRVPYVWIQQ